MVAHGCNPSTWEAEAGGFLSEFEARLVYRVSFRTARATQKNAFKIEGSHMTYIVLEKRF